MNADLRHGLVLLAVAATFGLLFAVGSASVKSSETGDAVVGGMGGLAVLVALIALLFLFRGMRNDG